MIPNFEAFMQPVLLILRDGQPIKRDDLRELCAIHMNFTKEELEERIKSNKKHKIVDRLQWATYYLLKAGLIERTDKATERITQAGKDLIDTGIKTISRQFLRSRYPKFAEFDRQTREAAKQRKAIKNTISKKSEQMQSDDKKISSQDKNTSALEPKNENIISPFEEIVTDISSKVDLLKNGLREELRGIVNDFEYQSFKNLLLVLFDKMGYTTNLRDIDLGVQFVSQITLSGLLNLDEFGFQKALVIAHNHINHSINQLDAQSFVSVLSNLNTKNGIYITLNTFSDEVYDYINNCNYNIVLVDGDKLTSLMEKFKLGTVTKHIFEINDINDDFLFQQLPELYN